MSNSSFRTGVATTKVRIRKLYHGVGSRKRCTLTTRNKATGKYVNLLTLNKVRICCVNAAFFAFVLTRERCY